MLPIITYGDDILTRTSEALAGVDEDLRMLVRDMFEAMYAMRGIGLAAVQVGRLIRLFITHVEHDKPRIFVNPDVVETSIEECAREEGCLSIPGVSVDVIRSSWVRIQAQDLKAKPFRLVAKDLLSRVVQHELDHLNGKLFVDRIDRKQRTRILKDYGHR